MEILQVIAQNSLGSDTNAKQVNYRQKFNAEIL
ncbi:hypothetical protein C4K59_001963 [Streptococcus thermophilus]|uniref:Uncharacterized protein n=1 Tax=Streptococcus thermophilus TaxID=1308 RepID=A0A2X3UAM7_STRTR|nr:hypothetical protein C4K59_001963 [Streptococcus thermophilus]SQF25810.1 Uncharacterised protein [Streptococcus thermophilus]